MVGRKLSFDCLLVDSITVASISIGFLQISHHASFYDVGGAGNFALYKGHHPGAKK
jgi:hypothetical protein